MNRSYELMASEEPDGDLAMLAAQVGRFMFFGGQPELAEQRIEAALAMAEALRLPEVFAQALTTKAVILVSHGRREEGLAVLRFALETAREHDKPSAALRASYNLAETLAQADGLETIPRRAVEYRGSTLEEMDLHAVLKREPELCLIDELAHTNAPGLEHTKRYEDIDDVLSAGTDVFSTVNVQHLESLNDQVAEMTGVRVSRPTIAAVALYSE